MAYLRALSVLCGKLHFCRDCDIVAFVRQITNPPNPYNKYSAEYVGEPPPTKLEIFEETATKKVITKAFASDWDGGWRYTVNCYRGCVHGCTYCFARQYHEYLGYGAGTDFETKIVVKTNAPEILRQELKKTRILALQAPQRLDYSMREHDQILDAFLKKNPALAESTMVRHLTNQMEALRKILTVTKGEKP